MKTLIVESSLPPTATLQRIRDMVSARGGISNPRFRRRQILGWRFRELRSGFSLQPEYGDAASDFGSRFEGRIEEYQTGSRVIGRVVLSRLMSAVMGVVVAFVLLAMGAAIREGHESWFKIVSIGGSMIAVAWLLVRYSQRLTTDLVEIGLKTALEVEKADPASRRSSG